MDESVFCGSRGKEQVRGPGEQVSVLLRGTGEYGALGHFSRVATRERPRASSQLCPRSGAWRGLLGLPMMDTVVQGKVFQTL